MCGNKQEEESMPLGNMLLALQFKRVIKKYCTPLFFHLNNVYNKKPSSNLENNLIRSLVKEYKYILTHTCRAYPKARWPILYY